ncbi:MAG: zinc-binding dehydrogenase [Mycobacterium sp.]|nr:zinc-binding dehydrogenase [Mycobacterium sp.]
MRAIVFDPDAPRKFAFADAPDPVPTAPNELLIDVKAISLNFGEVYYGDNAEHPGDIPGWDSAGVVICAAADGSGPPVGARVAGASWSQGWAQRRVLASENVAVMPDSVDFDTAAALPVAGVTAVQTIRRLGPVLGKRVLVTGASGGVGRLAVQLAARAGAHVIAAVGSPERGTGLRELGADEIVVGLDGVAPVHGVLEHIGGTVLADAYGLLADGGTLISVGSASGQSTPIDFEAARMARKNNRIESFMANWPLGEELQYVLDLTGRGLLDAQVGYRDSWDNLDAAIDALLGRRVAGKAALTVN